MKNASKIESTIAGVESQEQPNNKANMASIQTMMAAANHQNQNSMVFTDTANSSP